MAKWRLIIDGPQGGPANMAIDEALLLSIGPDEHVLRLYAWSGPTISIGYLQAPGPLSSAKLPLVRRMTGGRAVLHDDEVTYSVIAGAESPLFSSGILKAYSDISNCIVKALGDCGVRTELSRGKPGRAGMKDACFHAATRFEVLAGGRKLVGSAQRRFRAAFLQHGSIIMDIDKGLNSRVFGAEVLDKMSCVREFSAVEKTMLMEALVRSFASEGAEFTRGGLTPGEEALRDGLMAGKYSKDEWNLHGAFIRQSDQTHGFMRNI